MKQEFLKAKSDTIRLTIYDDNRPLIPTSATIALYNPSGSELQSADTVTIDSTTGEMSYSLTSLHTASLGLNYRAVWSYVSGGTTYTEEQLFDVVRSRLSIPIVDDDIFRELPSLKEKMPQIQGTATAATSTTLIDTVNLKQSDDYWTGGTLKIIAGTGVGQKRDISDFVQSTSTLTVSTAFTTTPDTSSIFIVYKSLTDQILNAYEKLCTMIYNKGKRHSLIIESSQIKFPLIYLTIYFLCLDYTDDPDDKWQRLSEIYWDQFNRSFDTLHFDYDEDESGSIDDQEKQSRHTSFRILRA
jgi:hypothetical protein